MLLRDNEKGELVISRVGKKRAGSALVEGANIEIGHGRRSGNERFSEVLVIGHAPAADSGSGPFLTLKESAKDAGVPRRRLLQDPPGPEGKWAKQRAEWEVARRYGRSRTAEIIVTGWRDGSDKLWTPNTLVHVSAPNLKLDEDMIIARVTWMRGPAGTQTRLSCMPPQGLQPAPFIPAFPELK